ncbi:MAG: hypothetical protein AAF146_26315, partial [Bacteroidota bacterium]
FSAVATATPEKRSVEQNQNLLKLHPKIVVRHTLIKWSIQNITDLIIDRSASSNFTVREAVFLDAPSHI